LTIYGAGPAGLSAAVYAASEGLRTVVIEREATVAAPDDTVRAVIFPVASEQTLQDLVKEYRTTGPAYRQHTHTVMRRSYRTHYRRALAALLDVLVFRSNNGVHRSVIRPLDLLRQYADVPS